MVQSRKMKSVIWSVGGAMVLIVALLGCQTTKPGRVAPTDSVIQVESSGFSPANAVGNTSIDILLLYGNADTIKSWKVEIVKSGTAFKSWSGDAAFLPSTITCACCRQVRKQ